MRCKKISITFRPFVYDAIYTLAQKQQMSFSRFVDTEMAKIIEHSGITQSEQEPETCITRDEILRRSQSAKENSFMFDTAEEAIEFLKSGKPYGAIGFNKPGEGIRYLHMCSELDL